GNSPSKIYGKWKQGREFLPAIGDFRPDPVCSRSGCNASGDLREMVVEQKALVEEALRALSLLRARRAYLQAINSGAKPAVALEASVTQRANVMRNVEVKAQIEELAARRDC